MRASISGSAGNSDDAALAVEASGTGIRAARTAVGTALSACLAATSTSVFCPVPGNGSSTLRAVPGSLHGTLVPASGSTAATDALEVTVGPDPNGVFSIGGTVYVNGSYQSLNYSNVPVPVTDARISVSISAQCYASAADAVTWKST